MKEISLNILDVATNSVTADATTVDITVDYEFATDDLSVIIADDGRGMSEDFVKSVTDPFTTTRTTRKVGLGIPLFKDSAELTGGSLEIISKLGVGTTIKAVYKISSIDRMPMGDLADTVTALIGLKESLRFILQYKVDGREFRFDTDEIRAQLDGIPLSNYEVLAFIKEYIEGGINNTNGGLDIL
ncbi:MAG: ATP-binding protein [Clostridia bacterium]|nr:ATP-binding protein [Clostridia bacterium]